MISKFREKQIKAIDEILSSEYTGSVYVCGSLSNSGISNSKLIEDVLIQRNLRFSTTNCRDSENNISMFLKLLYKFKPKDEMEVDVDENVSYHDRLMGLYKKGRDRKRTNGKAINTRTTPTILDSVEYMYEKSQAHIYLILENAEKLMEFDNNLMYGILKINELTTTPVTVFLVSELPLLSVMKGGLYRVSPMPREIIFPNLNNSETIAVVSNYIPQLSSKSIQHQTVVSLYKRLVGLVVDIFYNTNNNLTTITEISKYLFPLYIKPIEDNTIGESDYNGLYKHIEPYIRYSLSNIFRKDNLSSNYSQLQFNMNEAKRLKKESTSDGKGFSSSNQSRTTSRDDKIFNIGFSYHAKCLLISCYLASTYSKKKDKLLYTNKKVKKEAKQDKRTAPKWFTFNRVMAIMFSLFKGEIKESLRDSRELPRLLVFFTSRKLLQKSGNFASTKFKCILPFNLIKAISTSISFNIDLHIANAEFSSDPTK
ncbi:origin recognition complex subunit 5 [Tieghemostelium lacteum]|uniref:Origin recognition complex subunit 5 n=1 Tax=Tieghemostelium lacteum TaxID=361077 RepID=A0A152A0W2_TIELA|nr:origin recognition complex subunit 5 [Tieghemostelium lacteum]|eukprot:KYQ99891.1 origin recognition complex subunit 5 [Tieghemostelium lacteum]